jgi:hypothetical protein
VAKFDWEKAARRELVRERGSVRVKPAVKRKKRRRRRASDVRVSWLPVLDTPADTGLEPSAVVQESNQVSVSGDDRHPRRDGGTRSRFPAAARGSPLALNPHPVHQQVFERTAGFASFRASRGRAADTRDGRGPGVRRRAIGPHRAPASVECSSHAPATRIHRSWLKLPKRARRAASRRAVPQGRPAVCGVGDIRVARVADRPRWTATSSSPRAT